MLRALFRLILIVVVVVAIGAFFIGYRWARPNPVAAERPAGTTIAERPTGTTGSPIGIDRARARETGAKVGEKVAIGLNEAEHALANASLTAKIKSKMALDDAIQARRIDVDTSGSVVTLSGTVRSSSEHSRALQLARETEGVTRVVDRLTVAP
jgi:hypothetical protein